jgi:hypothetical protein
MPKNFAIFAVPFALLSLFAGIIAGLIRINWDIPVNNLAGDHGALMTGSFIGTLICLERSIIHPNKWWKLLPIVNGASIVLFLSGHPRLAYLFLIAGSFGLLALMSSFLRYKVSLSYLLLITGAFAWMTGNLVLFRHYSYPAAVKWWMIFLLWTIIGERLELSRMLPISTVKKVSLYIIIGINILGMLLPFHLHGNHLFAISLLGLSTWLFLFDMSRYAIQRSGQFRYIGLILLTGYGWLAVTGAWLLFWPDAPYAYDATLHSFFLGFVFSMIFGHVPIIFPGIFRVNISLYHAALYAVVGLFQFSLLARISGDAFQIQELRTWGALFNGIGLVLFFITTGIIILTRLSKKRKNHVATGG